MLPDKAKFIVCSIIKLASIAFDETFSYWSVKKSQLFIGQFKKSVIISAFALSPLLTGRVVHLQKLTEMGLMAVSAGLIAIL